jgi:lipoprotein signal peptidase
MSVVAVVGVVVLTRLASWRGIGRIWGAWVGVGLLVAGIVGNGVSRVIWTRGVPDFVTMGREVWNLADFEIGVGLTGGVASIAVAALLAFARERLELDLR